VQSAFDAYRQNPSFSLFGELLMDVWTGLVMPESLGIWEPQAAWAEQQHRLGNAPAAYAQFIQGMNHYHRCRWDEAAAQWNEMDPSALGYVYSRIAGAFHFRAICRSPSRKIKLQDADLIRLEQMLLADEADLELQFHAEMARHDWWRMQGDKDKTGKSRQRAEVLFQLVRLPSQQRELEALQRSGAKAAAPAHPAIRIYCFGGLKFVHNGRETRELLWKRRKTKELFLYLLLQPRFRAPRDHAAELLFGEADAEKMANRLYVAIHELKKMTKTWFGIPDAVFLKEGIVRLSEAMIEYLDVEEYITLSRVGEQLWRQDPELALEMFEKACQLYDDFLPEMVYLDWLEQYREMLASTQAGMLKRLAQHAADQRRFDQAESYVTEWLRIRPLQEEAHHAKIALLVRMGRKADAKRWYHHWEEICRHELGSHPMPELTRLVFDA
jgi:two-component SAPR family response regulator